jgi:phosphonate C-P lyase system protein PhnG
VNREEIFEIISVSDRVTICNLAEEVTRDVRVEILREQTGMVMARARDSVESAAFNLGEVLVSESEVTALGVKGYSMILGMDLEKAHAGAVLDAVVQADHPMKCKILDALEKEKTMAKERSCHLWNMVKTTRVEFEVMR